MLDLKQIEHFAIQAHGSQQYGTRPYAHHLRSVVAVMKRFGITDEAVLAAGWLHDVVEDTNTSLDDVRSTTSERVAQLVLAVTDGEGETREERKQRPYQLIPLTKNAILVKLADRIANVEACLRDNPNKLHTYQKEHDHFKQKLFRDGEADDMWHHLDSILEQR